MRERNITNGVIMKVIRDYSARARARMEYPLERSMMTGDE
jgi:hypothetical protein